MKKLMVSALTNKIYLTKVKQEKEDSNIFIATGEKEDYTDEAIRSVFEWFMNEHKKNEPNGAYQVSFPSADYVLTMTKKDK